MRTAYSNISVIIFLLPRESRGRFSIAGQLQSNELLRIRRDTIHLSQATTAI